MTLKLCINQGRNSNCAFANDIRVCLQTQNTRKGSACCNENIFASNQAIELRSTDCNLFIVVHHRRHIFLTYNFGAALWLEWRPVDDALTFGPH